MIEFDLRIDDARWERLGGLEASCLRALEAGGAACAVSGEVSVLLSDNGALHALNKQFRHKDKPTDVLSFPASEMEAPFLGDIAISFDLLEEDAGVQGKVLGDHLAHLLIHGLLHLAGYDHENDTEAAEMEALEIKALASIGIDDPYFDDRENRLT
jgi:probable rRNA maturation factor